MKQPLHFLSVLARFLFLGLTGLSSVGLADQVSLYIMYKLPSDPDRIHDARSLEANAISQRNIEIQACANGSDPKACEHEAEIAFRRRIMAIPGARFCLQHSTDNSSNRSTTHWLMDLSSSDVVDDDLDQLFQHLKPEFAWPLGLKIDTRNCELLRARDNMRISYYSAGFTQLVCRMLQRNKNATEMLWNQIIEGKQNPPTVSDLEFLLDHGANANIKSTEENQSALTAAASFGLTDAARVLIKHGAKVDDKDNDGLSPLSYAAQRNQLAVAKLLVESGANVNSKDKWGKNMPLGWAASDSSIDFVKFLVEHGAKVDVAQDDRGWTALMNAAVAGKADIVEYLIRQGAAVDTTDDIVGFTPLVQAAERGYTDVARVLLDHKASINRLGGIKSALMCAAQNGHTEVVRLLLDHGAAVNLRAPLEGNATALKMAEDKSHQEIVEILRQHGGTE